MSGIDIPALREHFRRRPPQMLHCLCCGERYERGRFRCCAPPAGMKPHHWLLQHCKAKEAGGCGKCARHCVCGGAREQAPVSEFAQWLEQMRQELSTRRARTTRRVGRGA